MACRMPKLNGTVLQLDLFLADAKNFLELLLGDMPLPMNDVRMVSLSDTLMCQN